MAQTSLNIEMDEKLKSDFEKFCDNVGLSISSAISLFAKTVVNRQVIPFQICALDENGFTPDEAAELMSRIYNMEKSYCKSRCDE